MRWRGANDSTPPARRAAHSSSLSSSANSGTVLRVSTSHPIATPPSVRRDVADAMTPPRGKWCAAGGDATRACQSWLIPAWSLKRGEFPPGSCRRPRARSLSPGVRLLTRTAVRTRRPRCGTTRVPCCPGRPWPGHGTRDSSCDSSRAISHTWCTCGDAYAQRITLTELPNETTFRAGGGEWECSARADQRVRGVAPFIAVARHRSAQCRIPSSPRQPRDAHRKVLERPIRATRNAGFQASGVTNLHNRR